MGLLTNLVSIVIENIILKFTYYQYLRRTFDYEEIHFALHSSIVWHRSFCCANIKQSLGHFPQWSV